MILTAYQTQLQIDLQTKHSIHFYLFDLHTPNSSGSGPNHALSNIYMEFQKHNIEENYKCEMKITQKKNNFPTPIQKFNDLLTAT